MKSRCENDNDQAYLPVVRCGINVFSCFNCTGRYVGNFYFFFKAMKILELTHDQCEKIADYNPEWVARNRPYWMANNHPDWLVSNRPEPTSEELKTNEVPDNIIEVLK